MLTKKDDKGRILIVGVWYALLQVFTPIIVVGFAT
jgi:hypothetical protein